MGANNTEIIYNITPHVQNDILKNCKKNYKTYINKKFALVFTKECHNISNFLKQFNRPLPKNENLYSDFQDKIGRKAELRKRSIIILSIILSFL